MTIATVNWPCPTVVGEEENCLLHPQKVCVCVWLLFHDMAGVSGGGKGNDALGPNGRNPPLSLLLLLGGGGVREGINVTLFSCVERGRKRELERLFQKCPH